MKTIAIIASLALHLVALAVIPTNDSQRVADNDHAVETTPSCNDSCTCDVDPTADYSMTIVSR